MTIRTSAAHQRRSFAYFFTVKHKSLETLSSSLDNFYDDLITAVPRLPKDEDTWKFIKSFFLIVVQSKNGSYYDFSQAARALALTVPALEEEEKVAFLDRVVSGPKSLKDNLEAEIKEDTLGVASMLAPLVELTSTQMYFYHALVVMLCKYQQEASASIIFATIDRLDLNEQCVFEFRRCYDQALAQAAPRVLDAEVRDSLELTIWKKMNS